MCHFSVGGVNVKLLHLALCLAVSESLSARPTKLRPYMPQRYYISLHVSDAEFGLHFTVQ